MKKKILLIGGKYTAKLVIEILNSKYEFIIFDEKIKSKIFKGNYNLVDDLTKINKKSLDKYFICVGDNILRKKYSFKLNQMNLKTLNIISNESNTENLKIGKGNLIYGNVYFDYFTNDKVLVTIEHGFKKPR